MHHLAGSVTVIREVRKVLQMNVRRWRGVMVLIMGEVLGSVGRCGSCEEV